MRKRVLVATIIGVLALLFAPAMPANATGEGGATAVVAVFTGNATVSPGLCLPVGGCDGPSSAAYNLTVPGASAPLPSLCLGGGLFEGAAVAPSACGLIANGAVTGSAPGLDPSCGLSHGTSSGVNTVSIGGNTRNTSNGWITSAGGTIPVTGNVDDIDADTSPAGDHTLVALVQARPITPAGTIACVDTPAETFIIVGVGLVV